MLFMHADEQTSTLSFIVVFHNDLRAVSACHYFFCCFTLLFAPAAAPAGAGFTEPAAMRTIQHAALPTLTTRTFT